MFWVDSGFYNEIPYSEDEGLNLYFCIILSKEDGNFLTVWLTFTTFLKGKTKYVHYINLRHCLCTALVRNI